MPIPTFQSILLPFLDFASDKKQHSLKECIEYLTRYFNLTEDDFRVTYRNLYPSGVSIINKTQ